MESIDIDSAAGMLDCAALAADGLTGSAKACPCIDSRHRAIKMERR